MTLARPLAFVGLPGAGKSTVGRAVAERLAVPFVDFDRALEARAGLTIPELFVQQGESAFRTMERKLTDELLGASPMVWAPGGGWVTGPGVLARVAGHISMIHLVVTPAAALARLAQDAIVRPLLAVPEPLAVLDRLARERAAAYAAADLALDTEALDLAQLVEQACAFAHAGVAGRTFR